MAKTNLGQIAPIIITEENKKTGETVGNWRILGKDSGLPSQGPGANIPQPPPTGAFILQSVDGILQWVPL